MNEPFQAVLLAKGYDPDFLMRCDYDRLNSYWRFCEQQRINWLKHIRRPSLADAKVSCYDRLLKQLYVEFCRRADFFDINTILELIETGNVFTWNRA